MSKGHRVILVLGCAALLTGLFPLAAQCEPMKGFGAFVGLASHSGSVDYNSGGSSSFKSSGLSLGVDYQFPLNQTLSINPFLMSSSESVGGDAGESYTSTGHGILGVELRYWAERFFVGAHIGNYSEVLIATSGSGASDTSASAIGFGVTGGWQNDDGVFVAAQVDRADFKYSNATHDTTGLRLHIGYRWKQG
jgi:hypothetical protein